MNKIKILFLAANPSDSSHLNLAEEIRQITEKIRASEYRDSLELISAWAVRPDDWLQLLNTHKPHIVHFSGHGKSTGEILLLDKNGNSKPVSISALKALFTTLKDNIRVVVLNSCYSKAQAEAISETIDFVIGVPNTIEDDVAIIFSSSFYRALGFNRSIQEAFDQGRLAVQIGEIQPDGTYTIHSDLPELFVMSGADRSVCILNTNPSNDVILLKKYRKIFARPAFQVACINELFIEELIEAIDDTQSALNTGSLYSRSGNLLAIFPSKDEYENENFREVFQVVAQELISLKHLIVRFEHDFRCVNSNYSSHENFFTMIGSLVHNSIERNVLLDLVYQMDAIDTARNQILIQLNQLYKANGEQPFELIRLSSSILKNARLSGERDISEYCEFQSSPIQRTASSLSLDPTAKKAKIIVQESSKQANYQVLATSQTPALIIFLLDVTGSMSRTINKDKVKIDLVSKFLQKIMVRMVRCSTKGTIVVPRYRIAMYAYCKKVIDLLGGIKTIEELVKLGVPFLRSTLDVGHPTDAFLAVETILKQELPNIQDCPAPLIIHMTDGEYIGEDPSSIVQRIMNLRVKDGNVLVENILIADDLLLNPPTNPLEWKGIRNKLDLRHKHAEAIFNMSSIIPDSYRAGLAEYGYDLAPEARLIFPSMIPEILELAFVTSNI